MRAGVGPRARDVSRRGDALPSVAVFKYGCPGRLFDFRFGDRRITLVVLRAAYQHILVGAVHDFFLDGGAQRLRPFTQSAACRSRTHCRTCRDTGPAGESFRASLARVYDPPADWTCPVGVPWSAAGPDLPEPALAKLPTRADMLRDFGAAAVRWASAGFQVVDQLTFLRRRHLCQICPHWDPTARAGLGKCRECGCISLKWHLRTEKCPIGIWGQEPTT